MKKKVQIFAAVGLIYIFFLHHLEQVKEGGNTLQLQDHHQGEKAALPT